MTPGEPLVTVQLDQLVATLRSSPYLLELRGTVQHYAWGGTRYLSELIGEPNPERRPFAEWWVGSHPLAPAEVRVGRAWLPITEVVRLAGDGLTGSAAAGRFGPGLPFLAKVLDVGAMLSIQAHPNREQAAQGFARESEAGLPIDSPLRNYRDPNHKPEASVALTDFWLLFGFKPPGALAEAVSAVPEFGVLFGDAVAGLRACGTDETAARRAIRRLYETAVRAPAAEADAVLGRLTRRLLAAVDVDDSGKASADYWLRRAARLFPPREGHFDRGLLSIVFLNLLHLAPGEAVFVPAGIPHAYLEGVAVEVMATSDNVIRGGLTPKRVDVDELLRVLTFEPTRPAPLPAFDRSPVERVYAAPVEEFEIARLTPAAGQETAPRRARGADLILVIEGGVTVVGAPRPLALERGGAALATDGLSYRIRAERPSVVFRVALPPDRR